MVTFLTLIRNWVITKSKSDGGVQGQNQFSILLRKSEGEKQRTFSKNPKKYSVLFEVFSNFFGGPQKVGQIDELFEVHFQKLLGHHFLSEF